VLWELPAGKTLDRRRIASLARGRPVISYSTAYSAGDDRDLTEFSRNAGFRTHLIAPLRPVDLDHYLTATPGLDLAAALRNPALGRMLARADVLTDMIRGANASPDPQAVAQHLAGRLAEWLPITAWGVVATENIAEPGVEFTHDPVQSGHQNSGRTLPHAPMPDLPPHVQLLTLRGPRALERWILALGGWLIHHPQDYLAQSLRGEAPAGLPPRAPTGAAIALPLTSRGRTLGAIVGLGRSPCAQPLRLPAATAGALRRVLEVSGIALDNALRIRRAEELSVTDDLTQLYNFRFLHQSLRRETKRASRSGRPLSLLFIDLDGFKAVNDVHGHLAGSRTLVEVADLLRTTSRETDVVARFGGDEFALVLPDTGSDGAVALGERIRERIATHRFLDPTALDIRLSASIGVATLPDATTTAEELIRAADEAMYWVKDHGKNGIHLRQPASGASPLWSAASRRPATQESR
jgi:diguanylate cyclase (GGDEF)-like protein